MNQAQVERELTKVTAKNVVLEAKCNKYREALAGMLTAFDRQTYQDQFRIGSEEDHAILKAREALK
jgi:hypothetical protein